jgi:glutathione S-transferase
MKKNNISINMKDARRNKAFAQELIDGGGKLQVPCLRIGNSSSTSGWLYESKDIILYLKKHLGISDEK